MKTSLLTSNSDTQNSSVQSGYSLARESLSAVLATLVLALVVSGLYPLACSGASARVLFNHQANGSLIYRRGRQDGARQ